MLFAVPSFLAFTDLGFSQSAANDMSQHVARSDHGTAGRVFQSLCGLVFGTALCGLAVTTLAVVSLPWQRWVHLTTVSPRETAWIIWLLAAEIFVRLTEGISHAGYRATGGYAFHTSIYYTTLLLQFTAIWALALLGYGPTVAAAGYLVIRCLVTPTVAVLLVRRQPWLRFGFHLATFAELRRLARPAIANLLMPLAQAINLQGMVLVIGAVLGPVSVAVFSTLRTLTRLAVQPVIGVSNTAEPELAAAYGSTDQSLLRTIFLHTFRLQLWLALSAILVLTIAGAAILRTWTHGAVTMHTSLFIWLLGSSLAGVLWYGAFTVLKAANRHFRAALLYCISAIGALALAGGLMSVTATVAAAGFAAFFVDVIMALSTLRAASTTTGLHPVDSLIRSLNPAPIIGLLRSQTRGREILH